MVKFTGKDEDIDTLIDLRAVFQQTFDQLAYEQMPSLLCPKKGKLVLNDALGCGLNIHGNLQQQGRSTIFTNEARQSFGARAT